MSSTCCSRCKKYIDREIYQLYTQIFCQQCHTCVNGRDGRPGIKGDKGDTGDSFNSAGLLASFRDTFDVPREEDVLYVDTTNGRLFYANSLTNEWNEIPTGEKGDVSPLFAKGDIYTHSTQNTRLSVGPNGSLLRANSTTTTGLEYIGNIGLTSNSNIFLGQEAGLLNTTTNTNIAIGSSALRNNVTGINNTAVGTLALTTSEASHNSAFGSRALAFNVDGDNNCAFGAFSLLFNKAENNCAFGTFSLEGNITASGNCAFGNESLRINNDGFDNCAFGKNSLSSNRSGSENSSFGANSLTNNTTGNNNTAIGANSLVYNTIGNRNTAVGDLSLLLSTGSNNIAIGYAAGSAVTTVNNCIVIGSNFAGNNTPDSTYIDNIFGKISDSGIPVYINSTGKMGTISSSINFKENIEPIEENELYDSKILELRPVSFTYKDDKNKSINFGLIAEEVEEILPDLVVKIPQKHTNEKKIYTVRYEQLSPLLINEIKKLNKTNELLKNEINTLKTEYAHISEQVSHLVRLLENKS